MTDNLSAEALIAELAPLIAKVDGISRDYADRISIPTALGYLRKVSALCAALRAKAEESSAQLREVLPGLLTLAEAYVRSMGCDPEKTADIRNGRAALAATAESSDQAEQLKEFRHRAEVAEAAAAAMAEQRDDARKALESSASPWRDMDSAPRDGTTIRALYDDGTTDDGVQWSEERCCILGPRAGAYPPGWISLEADGLPVGEGPHLVGWQPLPKPKAEGE